MKVIGINGSPRPNGNTNAALTLMGEVFAAEGVAFEILHVGHQLAPCSGCYRCAKKHECTLPDDGLNAMYQKVIQADGVVFGSPVYYASLTSGMRCFMDRLCTLDNNNGGNLRFKVGVPLTVARRAGVVSAMDELIHYINYASMILPGSNYWPVLYGMNPGQVKEDAEGVQTLQLLSKNMVWLMKALELGKAQLPPPEKERKVWFNYIR